MNGPDRSPSVILVEDDAPLREATAQMLELAGFEPTAFASAERAAKHVRPDFPGCIVTDIRMEGMDGLALMKLLNALDSELPVILVTGHGDIAMAVAALKDGAFDFLAKPFSGDQLAASVRRALQARALVLDNRKLRHDLARSAEGLAGTSEVIGKLRTTIGQMAMIDLDVLVEGESGVGKDMVALALHRQSTRGLMPFTAVRCSALGEIGGAEELFGASGLLARSEGGVLYLDEVEALAGPLQARLLAYLEARDRAGIALPPGVRLIAATRANIEECIAQGRFREDLYYRISVLRLRIPPLRERREDIALLFAQFVREALDKTRRKRFEMSAGDRKRLLEYDWPGNARELRNFAYSAVLNLPRAIPGGGAANAPGLARRTAAFEKMLLVEALNGVNGNVTRACAVLKVSRQSLYEKAAKHGLELSAFRPSRAHDRSGPA